MALRISRRGFASIAVSIPLVALLPRASLAIVEQVDGQIMPISAANCPGSGDPTSCVQVALNIGEGLAATSTSNPLNARLDAASSPEVFAVPRTGGVFGTVDVRDMVEGAGYENTFGWYNVDAPGTLYPITPCSDEPGSQRSVNFQTEFTAGRYLGGFIGFFLITPEDAPTNNNCGSTTNVGHIYYTESAKNGDGNYAHYLIYSSKVDPRRYYFGFEDLFRGGDNDFEDMFLRVDGLIVPCVPSAEICDGLDNNCDGLVDNDPVDAGDQCGLTDVGECSYGVEQCQMGALVCVGDVGPTPEVCDNLDNDCNGTIDDDPFGQNNPCGTDVGECSFGQQVCIGGVFVCVGGQGPVAETCNLLDDDCNGQPDDNTIDAGGPCGSNVGECLPGVLTCDNGVIGCVGGTGMVSEICDNLDNDCNGQSDDGDPGGGAPCGSDVGTCKSGVEHCISGQVDCIGALGPSEEICDGLDNDCDGTADNLAVCPNGSQCVEGVCAEPCGSAEFPCPGGQVCVAGFCVPGGCDDVVCDVGEVCENGVCIPESAQASTSSTSDATASTAETGGGAGGESGLGGAGNEGERNRWGLATGGSGVSCSTTISASPRAGAWALAAMIGLVLARRRRTARARRAVAGEEVSR